MHSDYLPAADYKTSNQPGVAYSHYANHEVGARERLLRQRAVEQAKEVMRMSMPPPPKPDFTTTNMQEFPGYRDFDPSHSKYSRREMFGEPKLWNTPQPPAEMTPTSEQWYGKSSKFSNPIDQNKQRLHGAEWDA